MPQGHILDVKYVAFSPDDKYLASSSGDKAVKLWSMEKFQEVLDP
jgi:WD40 repeat protein